MKKRFAVTYAGPIRLSRHDPKRKKRKVDKTDKRIIRSVKSQKGVEIC